MAGSIDNVIYYAWQPGVAQAGQHWNVALKSIVQALGVAGGSGGSGKKAFERNGCVGVLVNCFIGFAQTTTMYAWPDKVAVMNMRVGC
jgi:hypothetical protein